MGSQVLIAAGFFIKAGCYHTSFFVWSTWEGAVAVEAKGVNIAS